MFNQRLKRGVRNSLGGRSWSHQGPCFGVRADNHGIQGVDALLVLLVEAVGTPGDIAKGPLGGQLDLVRTGVEDDIRLGVADGSIRPDLDPRAQAFLLESLARGVLLQYQLDSSRVRLEEIGRAAHDMVLLALTADRRTG